LNIVLYVNSFLPVLGGREFVVHYLADALGRLGHQARVVGPAGFWRNRHERYGYPVHRWPTLRGFMSEQVSLASIALDTALWGADVIHAHNTWPTGYHALRLRRFRRYPLVVTPHGQDIQSIPEIGHGLRLDPALNEKIVFAVQNADLVTAISKNIENALLDAGAAPGRVRLIPNGVDLARYRRPPSTDIRRWLGVEPEARLIVTIGRYNPRKGQDYLVRAMPRILAQEPRARLVIVGNKTEALSPLIRELGLEARVVLTGGISPSRSILAGSLPAGETVEPDYLAELLAASEMYVSAGIQNNAEGLSLAVLEAMASGLPVVATAISGNTDVVSEGENGHLVAPADETALADGILRILTQPANLDRLRGRARETASRYAWTNVAQQYVDCYREAMEISRR